MEDRHIERNSLSEHARTLPNLALTPSVQLLIDPALNPGEDQIWVLGLRARLAL